MCDLLNMPDYVNMEAPFLFYPFFAIYIWFLWCFVWTFFWNRAYLVLLRNLRNHRSPQNLLDGIHKYFCLQKQRWCVKIFNLVLTRCLRAKGKNLRSMHLYPSQSGWSKRPLSWGEFKKKHWHQDRILCSRSEKFIFLKHGLKKWKNHPANSFDFGDCQPIMVEDIVWRANVHLEIYRYRHI